jgi:hypothetical protein
MLEYVLAINAGDASVWEGPGLAEIEAKIGTRIVEVDIQPAGFSERTGAEIDLQR